MWLLILLKGVIVGICASVPLGPIGVICVQQTVNRGRRAGFVSGYGAALADTLFATVALLSLTVILDFIKAHQQIIQIGGGIILIILGVFTFVRNTVRQFRKDRKRPKNYAQNLAYIFLLTLTNPFPIFIFLTLFTVFEIHQSDASLGTLTAALLGVHLGATAWWYILSYLVSRFQSFVRLKQLWWINKIAGALIILLGVLAVVYPLLFTTSE